MYAGVLLALNDIKFQEVPTPVPEAGQVLVKVSHVGICGSDVARVKTKGTYTFPLIPGHEFSGTIAKPGPQTSTPVGSRVVVYPLIACGSCTYCQKNAPNLCEHYNYLGSRCAGGFGQYVVCPESNILVLPSEVSLEQAALVEPLAVALRGMKRAGIVQGPNPSTSIIIYGMGMIGLAVLLWAKYFGVTSILCVDRNEHKRALAKKLGATQTCSMNSSQQSVQQADIIFECSGANACQEQAILNVKKQGTILLLGNPNTDVKFYEKNFQLLLRKEIQMIGSWNSLITKQENEWQQVLNTLATKKLQATKIISHRFSMDDVTQVFDQIYDRHLPNYTKAMFVFESEKAS